MDVVDLDSQTINTLPALGDDVVSAAAEMVGISPGSPGMTLIVDGVVASDTNLPSSMIQQIKINNNPYSAEFSNPGKGRIEVSTKEGSAIYHGSFRATLRDSSLDAKNTFAIHKAPEQRRYLEGSLSGPIGNSGNTTFLLDLMKKDDKQQSVVDAVTPGGVIRQNFVNPQTYTFLSSGIARKISDGHTVSIRYNVFDWSDNGDGVGGPTLPEAAYDSTSRRHYLYLNDMANFAPQLVNQFAVQVVTSDGITKSEGPQQPETIVIGAFTGGSAPVDKRETQRSLSLTDTLLWAHGNQLIKAGLNIPTIARRGLDDRSNSAGIFQFSSLADYVQGTPFSFVQQHGNGDLIYWQKELGAFVQDDIRVHPNLSVAIGLRYDWQNYISNPLNFAPRISIAYSPRKTKKLVLRAGAGVFYQTTGPQAIADMLRFNGSGLQEVILMNPSYPEPFSNSATGQALPSTIVRFSPDLRMPYSVPYSIGAEWQIKKSTAFTATYKGNRGFNLFLSRDVNAPLPPLYTQRPDPTIGRLREIESGGRLVSNSLELGVNTKLGRVFTGGAQYTFGLSEDNTGGIHWFPANQYDLSGEWSRSDSDSPHLIYFYGNSNVTKYLQIGLIVRASSGRPYTMTTGSDTFGTSLGNARPEAVPRNSLSAPGTNTFDLRVSRTFPLNSRTRKEGPSISIALDAFNVTNRVNFNQFIGNLSSPFFGKPVSAGPARQLQIYLGFDF
jgi:hypothetical protein